MENGNLTRKYKNTPVGLSPFVIGRETVTLLSKNSEVNIFLGNDSVMEDANREVSLYAFQIADISPIFIALKYTSGYGIVNSKIPFQSAYPFSHPGVDQYNEDTGTLTCKQSGLYYLSLTINLLGNQTTHVRIRHTRYAFDLIQTNNSHLELDTISRSAMFECAKGETVSVYLVFGSIYASEDLPATLIGFMYMYKPKHNQPLAWAAYKTTPFTQSGVVYFNEYLVNSGNRFIRNYFYFNVSGYYFLYTSNAIEANHHCQIWIKHFNKFGNLETHLAGMYITGFNYPGLQTVGRPFIARFEKGDTAHLYAYTGRSSMGGSYSAWSDAGRHISFIGFLVQPL